MSLKILCILTTVLVLSSCCLSSMPTNNYVMPNADPTVEFFEISGLPEITRCSSAKPGEPYAHHFGSNARTMKVRVSRTGALSSTLRAAVQDCVSKNWSSHDRESTVKRLNTCLAPQRIEVLPEDVYFEYAIIKACGT